MRFSHTGLLFLRTSSIADEISLDPIFICIHYTAQSLYLPINVWVHVKEGVERRGVKTGSLMGCKTAYMGGLNLDKRRCDSSNSLLFFHVFFLSPFSPFVFISFSYPHFLFSFSSLSVFSLSSFHPLLLFSLFFSPSPPFIFHSCSFSSVLFLSFFLQLLLFSFFLSPSPSPPFSFILSSSPLFIIIA
jgi:hypothetical protein